MKFAKREIESIKISMLEGGSTSFPVVGMERGENQILTVYAHEDKFNGGQTFCIELVNKTTGEVFTNQYRLAADQSHEVKIKEILLVDVAEKM